MHKLYTVGMHNAILGNDLKNIGLVDTRGFSLIRSTAGAFVLLFRVLSPKHDWGEDVLYKNWKSTKLYLGTSEGFFSKFLTCNPIFFFIREYPRGYPPS